MADTHPNSYTHATPRPDRPPEEAARIRIKNRRVQYLSRNPEYYNLARHDYTDTALYRVLVLNFLTPAEREARGRTHSRSDHFSQAQASMVHSLAPGPPPPAPAPDLNGGYHHPEEVVGPSPSFSSPSPASSSCTAGRESSPPDMAVDMPRGAANRTFITPPNSKEEGKKLWDEFLRCRFVDGLDEEFEYGEVDGDEEYDELERRDEEDAWFDEESPRWEGDDGDGHVVVNGGDQGSGGGGGRVHLTGETGIQDF
ncbi:hypothetical protein QBC47DRAFT_374314 [Echria macrotheca]|uniref:CCD97-like C-terminal domain-containing protein n=1 Tax=Echria macrotheca TaxID=438768 RepID=A0AAJ0BJJ7_9PEZI|nr:hypothetical protein QBC47DRAFT_374314 [Echria macrotheca]